MTMGLRRCQPGSTWSCWKLKYRHYMHSWHSTMGSPCKRQGRPAPAPAPAAAGALPPPPHPAYAPAPPTHGTPPDSGSRGVGGQAPSPWNTLSQFLAGAGGGAAGSPAALPLPIVPTATPWSQSELLDFVRSLEHVQLCELSACEGDTAEAMAAFVGRLMGVRDRLQLRSMTSEFSAVELSKVNVFNATTHLHRLLREHSKHGKAADSARHLLQLLTQLSAAHVHSFTPRHCVALLTAHAWIHHHQLLRTDPLPACSQRGAGHVPGIQCQPQLLDALSAKLQQAACSHGASLSISDLTRAVWALARLGHRHDGLAQAAAARMAPAVAGVTPWALEGREDDTCSAGGLKKTGAAAVNTSSSSGRRRSTRGESRSDGAAAATTATVATTTTAATTLSSTIPDQKQASGPGMPPEAEKLGVHDAAAVANLVWALGQLYPAHSGGSYCPSCSNTDAGPWLPLNSGDGGDSGCRTVPAAVASGKLHPLQGAAYHHDYIQLLATIYACMASNPHWLEAFPPKELCTLAHGLVNLTPRQQEIGGGLAGLAELLQEKAEGPPRDWDSGSTVVGSGLEAARARAFGPLCAAVVRAAGGTLPPQEGRVPTPQRSTQTVANLAWAVSQLHASMPPIHHNHNHQQQYQQQDQRQHQHHNLNASTKTAVGASIGAAAGAGNSVAGAEAASAAGASPLRDSGLQAPTATAADAMRALVRAALQDDAPASLTGTTGSQWGSNNGRGAQNSKGHTRGSGSSSSRSNTSVLQPLPQPHPPLSHFTPQEVCNLVTSVTHTLITPAHTPDLEEVSPGNRNDLGPWAADGWGVGSDAEVGPERVGRAAVWVDDAAQHLLQEVAVWLGVNITRLYLQDVAQLLSSFAAAGYRLDTGHTVSVKEGGGNVLQPAGSREDAARCEPNPALLNNSSGPAASHNLRPFLHSPGNGPASPTIAAMGSTRGELGGGMESMMGAAQPITTHVQQALHLLTLRAVDVASAHIKRCKMPTPQLAAQHPVPRVGPAAVTAGQLVRLAVAVATVTGRLPAGIAQALEAAATDGAGHEGAAAPAGSAAPPPQRLGQPFPSQPAAANLFLESLADHEFTLLCWAVAHGSHDGDNGGWDSSIGSGLNNSVHRPAPALLGLLGRAAAARVQGLDNQQLSTVLWAVAHTRHPCPELLEAAVPVIMARCPDPTLAQAPDHMSIHSPGAAECSVLPAHTAADDAHPSTLPPNPAMLPSTAADALAAAPVQKALANAPSLSPHTPLAPNRLALCLWAVAVQMEICGVGAAGAAAGGLLGTQPFSLLQDVAQTVALGAEKLSARGLAMTLWAFSSSQIHPGDAALCALAAQAAAVMPQLTPQGLALVSKALVDLRHFDSTLLSALATQLVAAHMPSSPQAWAVAGNATTHSRLLQALSSTATALAKAGIRHGPLIEASLTAVRYTSNSPCWTPPEAAPLLWALSRVPLPGLEAVAGRGLGLGAGSGDGRGVVCEVVGALVGCVARALGAQVSPEAAAAGATAAAAAEAGACQVAAGEETLKGAHPESVESSSLVLVLMACAALSYQLPAKFVQAAAARLGQTGVVAQLSTHTLCEVMAAMAAQQYSPPHGCTLLSQISKEVRARVLVRRQEALSLSSLVNLTWGLAYFQRYSCSTFERLAPKALSLRPNLLKARPTLLRMATELRMLMQAEAAPAYWRALQAGRRRRAWAGGELEALVVAPEQLIKGCSRAAVSAVAAVKSSVTSLVASGLTLPSHQPGARQCIVASSNGGAPGGRTAPNPGQLTRPLWHALPQGDEVCVFTVGDPAAFVAAATAEAWQPPSGIAWTTDSSSCDTSGGSASRQPRAVMPFAPGQRVRPSKGNSVTSDAWGSMRGMDEGVGGDEEGAETVQGTVRVAITMQCAWHNSMNDCPPGGPTPWVPSGIRDRVLVQAGFVVMRVCVREWVRLGSDAGRRCLVHCLASVLRSAPTAGHGGS